MNRVLAEESVPWAVYGTYSSFHIFTNPHGASITADDINAGRCDYAALKDGVRRELVMKLRLAMMLDGVEIFVWPGGPTAAVATDDDLEQTCRALRSALRKLKDEGEIR
jgi:glutamate-1-semialdehyde 2,1-aminomutase